MQGQILIQMLQLANQQMATLSYAYGINAALLVAATYYLIRYARSERKNSYKRHCYLLSIPVEEFKQNKSIQRYVSKVNDQSLFD